MDKNKKKVMQLIGECIRDRGYGYTEIKEKYGYTKEEVHRYIGYMNKAISKRFLVKVQKNEETYQENNSPEFQYNKLKLQEQEQTKIVMDLEKEYQDKKTIGAELKASMREIREDVDAIERQLQAKKEEWREIIERDAFNVSAMNAIYANYIDRMAELSATREKLAEYELCKLEVTMTIENNKRMFVVRNQKEEIEVGKEELLPILNEVFLSENLGKYSVDILRLVAKIEAIRRKMAIDAEKLRIICPEEIQDELLSASEDAKVWHKLILAQ